MPAAKSKQTDTKTILGYRFSDFHKASDELVAECVSVFEKMSAEELALFIADYQHASPGTAPRMLERIINYLNGGDEKLDTTVATGGPRLNYQRIGQHPVLRQAIRYLKAKKLLSTGDKLTQTLLDYGVASAKDLREGSYEKGDETAENHRTLLKEAAKLAFKQTERLVPKAERGGKEVNVKTNKDGTHEVIFRDIPPADEAIPVVQEEQKQ